VLAGVGTLIVGIGAIVGILGLSQAASIPEDRMLVDGQFNFEFDLGSRSGLSRASGFVERRPRRHQYPRDSVDPRVWLFS
ncbi:unnamed protein product, partial [Symbiodinium sp. CCMP2456]